MALLRRLGFHDTRERIHTFHRDYPSNMGSPNYLDGNGVLRALSIIRQSPLLRTTSHTITTLYYTPTHEREEGH